MVESFCCLCFTSSAFAGWVGTVAMSTFLDQPPESRWYSRTLSAIRVASLLSYHSEVCLRQSRHFIGAVTALPVVHSRNAAAPRNDMKANQTSFILQ